MKTLILILFLITNSFASNGQSQMEMNAKAGQGAKHADIRLNKVYQKILHEYSTDTLFINNLKTSQRLWVKFRDAELAMKFPDYGPYYYGSMHSMCVSGYVEKLTEERIKTLEDWLKPVPEGEGCKGSVMRRN